MQKLAALAGRVEAYVNGLLNRWYRPAAGVGCAAALWVNGVYVPLAYHRPLNLAELASLVTAVAGVFLVRGWEKSQGAAQGGCQ